MQLAKILVSAVLIPALLVASGDGASDSVQKLLRKPEHGPARIRFSDGTEAGGTVNRVTTQFLTLGEANTCRNVELAQISSIRWLPKPDDWMSLGDTLTLIAWVVIGSPFWVPWYIADALGHKDERSPLRGNWESIPTSPDGKISRIEGNHGNGFVQRNVAVAKGRYEVIGQDLHLAYDTSGLVETIPIQFDCDSLVLEDKKFSARFSKGGAQAPIVGRWHRHGDFREFTASGAFEKRVAESQMQGQVTKIKGGVRVKWLGPDAKPDEEWGIRTKRHHLFITAGGTTTEYVRAD